MSVAVRAPVVVGVAVTVMLQDELPASDAPQESTAMAKSPECAPLNDEEQPLAAVAPELVTVKVFVPEVLPTVMLPKELVAVKARDAALIPVTVIPFVLVLAETPVQE